MDKRLEALESEFVAQYLEFHPGHAMSSGLHAHDHKLEDLSPSAIDAYCGELDALKAKAEGLGALPPADAVERDVLLSMVEGTLFDYRRIRSWQNDPYSYSEVLSSQLNTILIFDYAPLEVRLRAVIAKERQVPRLLETAKNNLKPTAPILVEYGVRGAAGALSLVEKDLPAAFAAVQDPALKREFEEATSGAKRSLEAFIGWLRTGYPAGQPGDYALGLAKYSGWLAARERITTPIQDLEKWALDSIEKTREEIRVEAARIDPKAEPADVIARITADHPPTGQVVAVSTRIAEEVYGWLERKRLVTLPSSDRVLIADTPEFMRWSFGSMWTPGPYETAKVRATFYATDADPSWPIEQQNEHLTAFCYRGLENLSIHEAYPGHFIQGLHQNRADSPVRKTFWWGVFGEGWAHYCEQLALEEGFGDGAPEVHIVQLQEALNRLCRFVNGIRLHTRPNWDFDQGTRFFQSRAWLAEAVARAECERGAFDPFYLRYTLGKKEILELRAECKAALGSRFDLRAFHDALLGCGSGPMPAMRALTRLKLGID
jgi:hypothetical protein